jgi:HK97 family phage portal protein
MALKLKSPNISVQKISIRPKKVEVKKASKQIDQTKDQNSIIEPDFNMQQLIDVYVINNTARKCIELIAKNVVGKWFNIISDDGKKNDQATKVKDIMNGISPDKTFLQLIREMVIDLLAAWSSALEVSRWAAWLPEWLYNMPIATMKYVKGEAGVFKTGDRFVQCDEYSVSNRVYFNRYVASKENRTEQNWYYAIINNQVKTNEVIWMKLANPKSRLYGLSPAITLLRNYLTTKYAEEYNVQEFENGMLAKFVITVKNWFMAQESITQLTEYLQEVTSRTNRSTIPVLNIKGNNSDIKIEKLSAEIKDGSFLELMRYNRQEIYIAFGVPPVMLGITENSNRATALEEEKKFYEAEIMPLQNEIESVFTRMIKKDFWYENLSFKFISQDYTDFFEMNKVVENGLKSGRYTINEARQKMGEDPIDDEGANERFLWTGTGLINVKDLSDITSEAAMQGQGQSQGEAIVNNMLNIRKKIKERIDAEAVKDWTDDLDNKASVKYAQ